MELSFKEKYQALLNQDVAYEGLFITAVKSTGIFCRPTCHARKPKPENVVFYETPKQALQGGYRPCKVCHPLEPLGSTPQYIKDIITELHQHPYHKIKDYELTQRGIEPNQIRRWFKKNHQMTFHGYQRMLRINGAFQKISQGEKVTKTAFDQGYESLSGFNDGYQTIFGTAPTKTNGKMVINIIRFTTPLGPMYGGATDQGVCLVEFTDRRMLETEFKDLRRRLNAVILPGSNIHLEQLQEELSEYFEGKRTSFNVTLHTPGTEFQQKVWEVLKQIPYGKTFSYKQQAEKLHQPEAVRAVASANGMNRVSIIIPCHRVIGSDGSLTGYGGGLARKRWLLEHELSQVSKQVPIDF